MRKYLQPALWIIGITLVLCGVLDVDPNFWRQWYYGEDWGHAGGDRALVGGGIVLAAAVGLNVIERLKPRP